MRAIKGIPCHGEFFVVSVTPFFRIRFVCSPCLLKKLYCASQSCIAASFEHRPVLHPRLLLCSSATTIPPVPTLDSPELVSAYKKLFYVLCCTFQTTCLTFYTKTLPSPLVSFSPKPHRPLCGGYQSIN